MVFALTKPPAISLSEKNLALSLTSPYVTSSGSALKTPPDLLRCQEACFELEAPSLLTM
jgi:hypothetical protein